MNKKIILIVALFFTNKIALADFDIRAAITSVKNLQKNLTDENTGISKTIDDVTSKAIKMRQYVTCKLGRQLTAPATCASVLPTISANIPLEVLHSITTALRNKIIGSAEKQDALLYTILNILANAGVPDVNKVKDVAHEIDSVLSYIDEIITLIHAK